MPSTRFDGSNGDTPRGPGSAEFAAYGADIANGEKLGGGWKGCHCAYPQISGRRCAAKYLRKLGKSKLLGDGAAPHVREAADHYAHAWESWLVWGQHLGHKGPDNGWERKKHRAAGSGAICKALKEETLAIDEIERALAAMA